MSLDLGPAVPVQKNLKWLKIKCGWKVWNVCRRKSRNFLYFQYLCANVHDVSSHAFPAVGFWISCYVLHSWTSSDDCALSINYMHTSISICKLRKRCSRSGLCTCSLSCSERHTSWKGFAANRWQCLLCRKYAPIIAWMYTVHAQ